MVNRFDLMDQNTRTKDLKTNTPHQQYQDTEEWVIIANLLSELESNWLSLINDMKKNLIQSKDNINPEKMFHKQRFSLEEWTGIERALSGDEVMINGETYESVKEIRVSREQGNDIQQEQQKLKDGNSNEKVLMQIGAAGSGIIALITAFVVKGYKRIG